MSELIAILIDALMNALSLAFHSDSLPKPVKLLALFLLMMIATGLFAVLFKTAYNAQHWILCALLIVTAALCTLVLYHLLKEKE